MKRSLSFRRQWIQRRNRPRFCLEEEKIYGEEKGFLEEEEKKKRLKMTKRVLSSLRWCSLVLDGALLLSVFLLPTFS